MSSKRERKREREEMSASYKAFRAEAKAHDAYEKVMNTRICSEYALALKLFYNCQMGYADQVAVMLPSLSLEVINYQCYYYGDTEWSATSCFIAAYFGHAKVLKLLIKAGCDTTIKNTRRETPLHIACYNGNDKAVKVLLDARCDMYANSFPNDNFTPFFSAIQSGKIHIIKLLLEAGYDIRRVGPHGYSAIDYASVMNQPAILELLMIAELNLSF